MAYLDNTSVQNANTDTQNRGQVECNSAPAPASQLTVHPNSATKATPADLRAVTMRSVRPLCLFVMVGYGFISVAHFLTLPPDLLPVLLTAAVSSIVISGTLFVLSLRELVDTRHADMVMHVLSGILLFNSVLHLVLAGEPHQAVNIGLVIVCLGLFHLSIAHFAAAYLVVFLVWMAFPHPSLSPEMALHYDFFLLNATLLSLIGFIVRRRAYDALIAAEKSAISREKEMERALERAHIAEVIADHERIKREFLANMSHELRTPLNAIIGFSEVLEHEMFGSVGGKENKEYVSEIHIAGKKLLQHLNDLLDLASLSNINEADEFCRFELAGLCTRSIAIAQAREQRPTIEVRGNCGTSDISLYTEERFLKLALVHIISNAIKFNRNDGTVDIVCSLNPDGEPEIRISDTGRGMDKREQEQALEPFWQRETGLTRDYAGIGLGLALTSEMVSRLKGRMAIESKPDFGTTVILTLPRETLTMRDSAESRRATA